jgi:hypothetical protein
VNVCTSAKNKHHKKRIGIAVLVAAIVIVASLSTAMAVNTDFRAAVIAFFKLSTPEIVVEDNQVTATGDITIISSADVDGLVDINYLKIDDNYEYNDGVVFTYRGTPITPTAFIIVLSIMNLYPCRQSALKRHFRAVVIHGVFALIMPLLTGSCISITYLTPECQKRSRVTLFLLMPPP